MAQTTSTRSGGRPRRADTVQPDGDAIRDHRVSRGLSVVELGKLTGRHPQTIRNLELEAKMASRVLINQVANALHVAVDEITKRESAA